MLKVLFKLSTFILSPPYCEGCSRLLEDRFIFCSDCYLSIKPVANIDLEVTKNRSVKLIAISQYEYPLKKLILAKKISNKLSAEYLAQLIWYLTTVEYMEFDYIVPIPIHWLRRIRRGYNQADIMALELSRFSGKPVVNALRRRKITQFQSELSARERELNVKDCFALTKGFSLSNKKILLVDDLATSGATLKCASKEIFKAGAHSVMAVVGCRVV